MILPDLAQRIAVVTGANGGIGQAVCKALLAQETAVIGLDSETGNTDQRDKDLQLIQCDLSQSKEILVRVAKSVEHIGPASQIPFKTHHNQPCPKLQ